MNGLKTNDLENYIIVYLSKEEIKRLFLGIQAFIKIFKLKKTDFSEKINRYKKEVDNQKISLENKSQISEFVKEYLNLEYEYDKDEQSDLFIDCIEMLPGKEGSIFFAKGKEEWEIRNLNEFIGMEENPLLQADDILDFAKSALFINSIFDEIEINENDEIIYQYFKNKLNEDNLLLNSFKEYLNKYELLENLCNEYLNKPEVSKIKIASIINNCKIKISNFIEGESAINFVCKYISSRNNKEIDITFDELNELRDRALISNPSDYLPKNNKTQENNIKIMDKNSKINEVQKKRLKENEKFLIFVENIKTIRSYLEKLNYKGYPKNIEIIIDIKIGKIYPKIIGNKKIYSSL